MNPFKVLKGIFKAVPYTAPLLLFGGGLTGLWVPCSLAYSEANKKVEDFVQTEIFQELKAEDEAELAIMKQDLDIAEEKHEKGEMSAREYLDIKYEYDQKYALVNSDDYVVSVMEKFDPHIYDDYVASLNLGNGLSSGGVMYTAIGAFITAAIMLGAPDFSHMIDDAFDTHIADYDYEHDPKQRA